MTHPPLQLLRWGGSWSQSIDQPQDLLEQFLRHRDLGHLEHDVAAMADDLDADLHDFLPQAGQRSLLARRRQSQRPHEVCEIVDQCVELKPHAPHGFDIIVDDCSHLAEIGDVRRFETPRQLMAYLGLVHLERSTSEQVRRGGITKAGNTRARRVLIERAWTYREMAGFLWAIGHEVVPRSAAA